MRGNGVGLVGGVVVGITGASIGSGLLPRLNIHLGVGLLASIFDASGGAGEAVVTRKRETHYGIGALCR
jgi:uncharacterized membrane protein YeaQ/YmgE (transglycosylase-associated protein family)